MSPDVLRANVHELTLAGLQGYMFRFKPPLKARGPFMRVCTVLWITELLNQVEAQFKVIKGKQW